MRPHPALSFSLGAAGTTRASAIGRLDTGGTLIVVLDAERRIVRLTQKCEAVTDFSADEVMGSSVFNRPMLLREGRA